MKFNQKSSITDEIFRSESRGSATDGEKKVSKDWIQHLYSGFDIKTWTPAENAQLLDLHTQFGNRWKLIASYFPGRTDNQVKNQFFATARKMLRRACKFLSISCNTSFVNKIKPKVMSELLNRPIEGLSKSLSAVSTTEKPHTFRDFICHVFSQSPAWIRNSQEAKDVQKVLSSFMQAITVEK